MRSLLALLFVGGVSLAWVQQQAAPELRDEPPQVGRLRSDLDSLSRIINDFGGTRRYAADNRNVPPPAPGEERVVFMGDSITDFWGRGNNGSTFFTGKPYINRGISGQVTAQMLLRFHQDVVALKPVAVVILAGTNDIGSNIGPVTQESMENNLASMVDLAKANHIKVVLSSVMPVCDYIRPQTAIRSPERILALNRWIKDYAAKNGLVYLDYFAPMVDDKGMFRRELTDDGLHPNKAGYEIMAPLASKAIASALGK
jgi:lysophospholipase L1-like esterase